MEVEPEAGAATHVTSVGALRIIGASELPTDIHLPGKVVKGLGWEDKNGDNVVALAIQWIDGLDEHDAVRNVYLTVEHAAYRDGTKRVLRVVKDKREVCGSKMTASFLDDAIALTDLDRDGYGELTLAYLVTCDDSSAGWFQKLVLLENGEKYILRSGVLRAPDGKAQFDSDPVFASAPPSFLEHCRVSWEKLPAPPKRPFD